MGGNRALGLGLRLDDERRIVTLIADARNAGGD